MTETSHSRHYFLPLSACSEMSLTDVIADEIKSISRLTHQSQLERLCQTACLDRFHDSYRVFACGEHSESLIMDLQGIEAHTVTPVSSHPRGRARELVFVFTGLGSEWSGMARDLLEYEPVFKDALAVCDAVIYKLTGWSLLLELSRDQEASRIGQSTFAQPALLAIQVALVSLWRAWGIEPDAVVGHSAGDIAAAFTASVLSLEDAFSIACNRGRLMDRESGRGRMLAVAMTVAEVEKLLPDFGGGIEIAAINGPSSITLSGDRDAIISFLEHVKKDHTPVKKLNIDYAYHSHKQDPIRSDLLKSLEHIRPQRASLPLYSSVTGDYSSGENWDSNYWWRNSRDTVHFAPAIDQLIKRGYRTFLEIGPHASLQGSVKDCLSENNADGLVLPSMRKGLHDQSVMFSALGQLYSQGFEVNWEAIYP